MGTATHWVVQLARWVLTGIVGLAALAPIVAGARPLYEAGPAASFAEDAVTFRDAFAHEWASAREATAGHVDTNLDAILPRLRPEDRAAVVRLRRSLDEEPTSARDTLIAIGDRIESAEPLAIARSPVVKAMPWLDAWWMGAFLGWVVSGLLGRRLIGRVRWFGAVADRTGLPVRVVRDAAGAVAAGAACVVACTVIGGLGARLDVRVDPNAESVRTVSLPIPFDPAAGESTACLLPPGGIDGTGARHWLGTDVSGQDVASRLVWGARRSLVIGGLSVALLLLIGLTVGTLAGFSRGADLVLSRVIEVVDAFPPLLLVLSVVALVGASPVVLIAVIAGTGWTKPALLTRGEVSRIRRAPFVEAARTMGVPLHRILFVHVLPNASGPAIVHGVFAVATAILIEAGLSFLGLGAANVVSWGRVMMAGAQSVSAWWLTVFPGAILFATILSLHVVAARLRGARVAWEVA